MSSAGTTLTALQALRASIGQLVHALRSDERAVMELMTNDPGASSDAATTTIRLQAYSQAQKQMMAYSESLLHAEKEIAKQTSYLVLVATRGRLLEQGEAVFGRYQIDDEALSATVLDTLQAITYDGQSSPVATHASRLKVQWLSFKDTLSRCLIDHNNQAPSPFDQKAEDELLDMLTNAESILADVMQTAKATGGMNQADNHWRELSDTLSEMSAYNGIAEQVVADLAPDIFGAAVDGALQSADKVVNGFRSFCRSERGGTRLSDPALTLLRADLATASSRIQDTKNLASSFHANRRACDEDGDGSPPSESSFETCMDDTPLSGLPPTTFEPQLRILYDGLRCLRNFCCSNGTGSQYLANHGQLYLQVFESSNSCVRCIESLLEHLEEVSMGDAPGRMEIMKSVRAVESQVCKLHHLAEGFLQRPGSGECTLLDKLLLTSFPEATSEF